MKKESKRKIWQYPWGYKESFALSFCFLLVGVILEIIAADNTIQAPSWPVNFIIIVLLVVYIILSSRYLKHPVIKWLSSIEATLSAISVFTVLVLLMGFIPQNNEVGDTLWQKAGFTHISRSWPYLMSSLYLLVILGFTTARRVRSFSLKNIAFFLNHFGLWLIIVSASLGNGDLYRLKLRIVEGQTMDKAYDAKDAYRLPFAIQLKDFKIDDYPPEIGLYAKDKGTLLIEKGDKFLHIEDKEKQFKDWNIRIEKYLPFSSKFKDEYIPDSSFGSFASVYLKAQNAETKEVKEGWVTFGNFAAHTQMLDLDEKYAMAMLQPKPEKFSSDVRIFTGLTKFQDVNIEVNKPLRINGWTIYQLGYDEQYGKWSQASVLEFVRDPWINVIYIGIFMVLLGSVYLFWMGAAQKQEKTIEE
jgi:hypothetical protein